MAADTKGHEFYIRHILLLGKAATIPLIDIVKRLAVKRNTSIENILTESKKTIKMLLLEQYFTLFPNDAVNLDLQSWDTRLLCVVLSICFVSQLSDLEREAITCILEQRNDLDSYSSSAFLDFNSYNIKWRKLHKMLLRLTIRDRKAKFKFTRLIQSFANEPIHVNMPLIEQMKEATNIIEQLRVADENKVYTLQKSDHCEDEKEHPEYVQLQSNGRISFRVIITYAQLQNYKQSTRSRVKRGHLRLF